MIYLEKEIYNFDVQKELGQYQAVKFTNAYPELTVGEYMKMMCIVLCYLMKILEIQSTQN